MEPNLKQYLEARAASTTDNYMAKVYLGQRYLNAKLNGLVFEGCNRERALLLLAEHADSEGVDLLDHLAKEGIPHDQLVDSLFGDRYDVVQRTLTMMKVDTIITNWGRFIDEALGPLLTYQDAYDALMLSRKYAVFGHRWEYGEAAAALKEVVDGFLAKGNKSTNMFVDLVKTMVRYPTYAVEYADYIVPVLRHLLTLPRKPARPDLVRLLNLPLSTYCSYLEQYVPVCTVLAYLIDEFWEDMDTERFIAETGLDDVTPRFWRDVADGEGFTSHARNRFRQQAWSYIKFCSKALFLRDEGARVLLELSLPPPQQEAPRTILDSDPDYRSEDDPDYEPSETGTETTVTTETTETTETTDTEETHKE